MFELENGDNTSSEGVEPVVRVSRKFTVEQTFAFLLTENHTRITCLAPSRNSVKWHSASLNMTELLWNTTGVKDTPKVGNAALNPVYEGVVGIIGIVSVGVILIFCTILGLNKYTESKVRTISSIHGLTI